MSNTSFQRFKLLPLFVVGDELLDNLGGYHGQLVTKRRENKNIHIIIKNSAIKTSVSVINEYIDVGPNIE
jgi:hypothetical protein